MIRSTSSDAVIGSQSHWSLGYLLDSTYPTCSIGGDDRRLSRTLLELERRFTNEEAVDSTCLLCAGRRFVCPLWRKDCLADESEAVAVCELPSSNVGNCWDGFSGQSSASDHLVSGHVVRYSQKNGVSALGLQRALGLRSYKTAWAMLHKLRRAMVRPGRDRLHGTVEVDETYWGAKNRTWSAG